MKILAVIGVVAFAALVVLILLGYMVVCMDEGPSAPSLTYYTWCCFKSALRGEF